MNSVRVDIADSVYYGKLLVTPCCVTIFPNDPEVGLIAVDETQLDGINELEPKGLKLNQRFNKPPILLYFRSVRERNIVLNKMRRLIRRTQHNCKFTCPNLLLIVSGPL